MDGSVSTDTFPATAADCDGRDPAVHRGAPEICDGKDNDCNGRIDEGFDKDGDGWVSCAVGDRRADCDDGDRLVNPGAAEVCDGKDNDCDGKIDDGFDNDGDGYFACARAGVLADCDDADTTVHPGAIEQCNAKDDDCNGQIDELPVTLNGSLASPIDPHWALAGSARFAGGWVELTPDSAYQAGGLFWNANYLFDTFDVSATFWIQAKSDGADGLAFAFVPGTDLTALGHAGAGYGVVGLGGYAVAVDTFAGTGEPAAPYLVVVDARTGAHLLRQTIPNVRDGADHRLRVALDKGKLSVWLDFMSYIFEFPLPDYAPFRGHWGFTAATGGLSSTHYVRSVSMSFPKGQGCVP